MLFRSDLAKQWNGAGLQTKLSEEARELWCSMPNIVQSYYYLQADIVKSKHKQNRPNYAYKPTRKESRGETKAKSAQPSPRGR